MNKFVMTYDIRKILCVLGTSALPDICGPRAKSFRLHALKEEQHQLEALFFLVLNDQQQGWWSRSKSEGANSDYEI